jgi:glycosyltransferase involved in cell wall biosynthesis
MAKITVGVGVTTFRRPEMLQKCLDSIRKHTFMDGVTIYVADDSNERLGVSKRKNECLRALKDCDYVFLFDDDCYPIKDGWIEFFTESKLNHLLFLNESHNKINTKYKETDFWGNQLYSYADCGGVFMFMSKIAIDKVGAFDEKYEFWGLEHCDWSMRYADGLKVFYMLEGTENYIYSEDYSNPNHKSSITNEEKNLLFKKNFPKFAKGIDKIYLPL